MFFLFLEMSKDKWKDITKSLLGHNPENNIIFSTRLNGKKKIMTFVYFSSTVTYVQEEVIKNVHS